MASYVKFDQMSALRFGSKSSDKTDMMISVHSSRSAAAVVNVLYVDRVRSAAAAPLLLAKHIH